MWTKPTFIQFCIWW